MIFQKGFVLVGKHRYRLTVCWYGKELSKGSTLPVRVKDNRNNPGSALVMALHGTGHLGIITVI